MRLVQSRVLEWPRSLDASFLDPSVGSLFSTPNSILDVGNEGAKVQVTLLQSVLLPLTQLNDAGSSDLRRHWNFLRQIYLAIHIGTHRQLCGRSTYFLLAPSGHCLRSYFVITCQYLELVDFLNLK